MPVHPAYVKETAKVMTAQEGSPAFRWLLKKEVNIMTNILRIETGTPEGDALGFTSELFSGWLQLYRDNRMYLHYIISRHRGEGNVQALIHGWLERGYDLRVVMPRKVMQHILEKFGFISSTEYLPGEYDDRVEVWYRPSLLQADTPYGIPAESGERL